MMQSRFFLGDISLRITLGQVSRDDTIPAATSLLPLSGKVFSNNTKLISKVFKLYSGKTLCQHINNLFIGTHILELYGSLLYHISNVEISDFYVLRSIMEQWVLCHLWLSHRIKVVSNSMLNKPDISF